MLSDNHGSRTVDPLKPSYGCRTYASRRCDNHGSRTVDPLKLLHPADAGQTDIAGITTVLGPWTH